MTTGTEVHDGSWIVRARSNGCNLPTMDLGRATRSLAQATKDRERATTGTAWVHTACARVTMGSAQAHTARTQVTMDFMQAMMGSTRVTTSRRRAHTFVHDYGFVRHPQQTNSTMHGQDSRNYVCMRPRLCTSTSAWDRECCRPIRFIG